MKGFAAVILFFAATTFAQTNSKSFVILERVVVAPNREMVLVVSNPEKHPRTDDDDIYTCPDNTRGHYYTGVARVQLFDTANKKYLSETIIVSEDGEASNPGFIDLPYLIKRTGYYDVPKVDKNGEGKPTLMKLKDYNGDGKAQEFALFDAPACMGLATTLIGYDAASDAVIQYETELKTREGTSTVKWVDYLFGRKPDAKGVYRYQIDYRGRGGTLDKYEVRYDRRRRMFVGSLTSVGEEEKERPSK